MKKVFYDEGPKRMSFGEAGIFQINEPREVDDQQAAVLIRKGRLKEWPAEVKKVLKDREKED